MKFKDTAYINAPNYTGHVTIVRSRRVSRGRQVGQMRFTLAALEHGGFPGDTYSMDVVGVRHLLEAKRSFSDAAIEAAIVQVHGTQTEVAIAKESRAKEDRKAQGSPDWNTHMRRGGLQATDKMAVGDTVVINYKGDVRRDELLVGINPRTGRIAIEALRNKSGKRWIDASLVVEVRKA